METLAVKPNPADDLFRPHAGGINYKNFMGHMANNLRPRTYLEVGTQMGASLALFSCDCIAIDPLFQPKQEIIGKKKSLLLFQTTSDDFFEKYNVAALFPANPTLDMAFLDGMHHFEFLLRDFINAEKASRPDSIILMHDTFPIVPRAAGRRHERRPFDQTTVRPIMPTGGGWAGDVWKVVSILRKYRPDLEMLSLDTPPTGLSLVTRLDPGNTVLTDHYDEIMAEFMEAEFKPGWFDAHYDAVELVSSRELAKAENMIARFKPFQIAPDAAS